MRSARMGGAWLVLVAFLAVWAAVSPGVAVAACPSPWQGNTTCVYGKNPVGNAAATGSVMVPAGVTSLNVTLVGGHGGGGFGGCGARIVGVLPIPPGGEQLTLVGGADGAGHFKGPGAGGGGGGGSGGFAYFPPSADGSGSGGGGGSFLFGPQGLLVAAGGGGGGDGGGAQGGSADGTQAFPCSASGAGEGSGGQPGTQSAGGQGGVGDSTGAAGGGPATALSSYGNGGTGAAGSSQGGGGGGGGYYGGGGGGGSNSNGVNGSGGGGAGSNYVSPKLSSYSILQNNTTFVGGSVTLRYTPTCTGAGLSITSATPEGDATFGARTFGNGSPQVGDTVDLTGSGFCPGMQVQFGNSFAVQADVTVRDGTHASAVVPFYATTGTLSVTEVIGSQTLTASLNGGFSIDSFRDVNGFSFKNPIVQSTFANLRNAFPLDQTTYVVTVDPCASPQRASPASGLPVAGPSAAQAHCPVKVREPLPTASALFAENYAPHGVCFGWVLGSEQLMSERPSASAFARDLRAQQTSDHAVWSLAESPALDDWLDTQWWKQYSQQVTLDEWVQFHQPRTGAQIAADVESNLAANALGPGGITNGVIVSIYDHGDGHSLLAYGVTPSSHGGYHIWVNDPNTPFQTGENTSGHLQRISSIDLDSAGAWSYGPLGWSGAENSGSINTDPFSIASSPHLTLPGRHDTISAVVLTKGTALAGLTNASGLALDLSDPVKSGVVSRPPISSTGTSNASFMGKVAGDVQTLSGASRIGELFAGQGAFATVDASAGTDRVIVGAGGNSAEITPASGAAARDVAHGHITAVRSSQTGTVSLIDQPPRGAQHTVSVTGSVAAGGFRVAFSGSRGAVTISPAKSQAGSYIISLGSGGGASLPGLFSAGRVSIPRGDTLTITPRNWGSLNDTSVAASLHGHGRTLRKRLHNGARAIGAKIGGLSVRAATIRVRLRAPRLAAGTTVELLLVVRNAGRVLFTSQTPTAATSGTTVLRVPAKTPHGAVATVAALTLGLPTTLSRQTIRF